MTSKSVPTRTTNFSLILLWAASLAVAATGWVVMTRSVDTQAELYAANSQDVHAVLGAQSAATLGTTLIGVGVLGLLVALAVHAHNFALAQAQAALSFDDFDDIDADGGFEDLGVKTDSTIVHSTETPASVVAGGLVDDEAAVPVSENAPDLLFSSADADASTNASTTESTNESAAESEEKATPPIV